MKKETNCKMIKIKRGGYVSSYTMEFWRMVLSSSRRRRL
jgi:hypothetical protein